MLNKWRSGHALVLGVLACAVLTGVVWLLGQRLNGIAHLPDQGASWYYWKLPEPTLWTRLSAWIPYAAHQLALWGLIYYAQTRVRTPASGLHRVNLVALAVNASFIVLHMAQTQLFYDGLAQDASIFSSQGSVILLLVFVLIMENRRRGLFFGKPAPIGKQVVDFARRYHGYLFSWAAVYTFWYHPMEATSGHLIGFFYMFLLLLQGSLFLTRAHTNRWWTVTMELAVAVHGTLVAVMTSGPHGFWPMFLFGFLGVFIITQMHGLGLPRVLRWVLALAYTSSAITVYAARHDVAGVLAAGRIPAIEYVLVTVCAGLIWLGLAAAQALRSRPAVRASGRPRS
ncbi:hypothetical protein AB0L53_10000 [Nonomuraea sp. NPDC052129]|uniref:hypothetical protein n=1 Tax=Nonomuraea sp. NPDC052129 TaxID=3154651 RepID=UPI003439B0DD